MKPADQGRAVREVFSGDADRYDARQYQARHRTLIADRQLLVNAAFRELALPAGSRVLDVACGPGRFLLEASSLGVAPVGIDSSLDMLRTAAARLGPGVPLVLGDATALPFESATFEAVNCSGLIEYLSEPELLLGEIFRVLKPGRRALIASTNRLSPALALEPLVDAARRSSVARRAISGLPLPFDEASLRERKFRLTFHTPAKLRALLHAAGFERTELRYYHLQLIPHPFDRLVPAAATACVAVTDRLLTVRHVQSLAEGLLAIVQRPDRD